MTEQELIARLSETLEAAQRRWRKSQSGFGALVTPTFPAALIDQVAAGLAPVLRALVNEAVGARQDARPVLAEKRLAATDLRPSKEAG